MRLITRDLNYSYNGEYKYAILKDGTIVKPHMWALTTLIYNEEEHGPYSVVGHIEEDLMEQEIYFKYRLIDKIKLRRETAFVHIKDIIAFSNKIRDLKKLKVKLG